MQFLDNIYCKWINTTRNFASHSNVLKINDGKVSRQHLSVCLSTSGFLDPFFSKKKIRIINITIHEIMGSDVDSRMSNSKGLMVREP
ncbi:hypothetical protein POUND7_008508 [Theobroma cacao]